MRFDKTEFDKGIVEIKNSVIKFGAALAEMDKEDNQKILAAGNWFYDSLQQKLVPLREQLKLQIVLCVDQHEYDSILILIDCLQEIDGVQKLLQEQKWYADA